MLTFKVPMQSFVPEDPQPKWDVSQLRAKLSHGIMTARDVTEPGHCTAPLLLTFLELSC